MVSRSARPIVALARQPGPNTPSCELIPSRRRCGPFTMVTCTAPDSVAVWEWKLWFSSVMARMAVAMSGMYSGSEPAITALMASFSAVMTMFSRVGTVPITASGARPAASSMSATRAGVGGTMGMPSVHPRSKKASMASKASPASIRFEVRVAWVALHASGPQSSSAAMRSTGATTGSIGLVSTCDACRAMSAGRSERSRSTSSATCRARSASSGPFKLPTGKGVTTYG